MTEVDIVRTPVGWCTVAVSGGRILRVILGKGGVRGSVRRLPRVRRWLSEWFSGRPSAPPLDFSASPPFARRVYEVVRRIPPGRTMTYGEVARRAGSPGAARAVGNAMARNPIPLFVPCHRVVGSAGLGGFSADGGVGLKRRLLAREHPYAPLNI
jgi:O-6-methylguanine DNA methyltransferase